MTKVKTTKLVNMKRKVVGYINSGSLSAAESTCRKMLRIDPHYFDALQLLAFSLQHKNNHLAAVSYYQRALESIPANVDRTKILINLGYCYDQLKQLDNALETYDQCLKLNPSNTIALLSRAKINNYLGRHEEALIDNRMMIASSNKDEQHADENRGRAYLEIMRSPVALPSDEDIQQLKNELGNIRDDNARSHYLFALALGLERQKKFDEAFDCFQEANQMLRKKSPFDFSNLIEKKERLLDIFTPERVSQYSRLASDSKQFIFIVGPPRSGSTLLETIISAHTDIHAAGELTYIDDSIMLARTQMNNKYQYPEVLAHLDDKHLRKMRDFYLDNTAPLLKDHNYLIDKMPGNFWHVGMILCLFPNAKIIDIYKNPMDSVWSLFKQNFAMQHPYANDLNDCKNYYYLYKDIMVRWDQLFPNAIYHLCYENLIADPEACSEALFNYLGLNWHKDFLQLKDNKRKLIKTTSSTQVREGIYSSAVNHWKNYESKLKSYLC